MSIIILYEDNHVLVLKKPHGLLTQPTDLENDSLQTRAKQFIKNRDNKPGQVFLEPIHRIDKPVGGIVVFAKTSKALSRLMKAIREKKCLKFYRAVIVGQMPSKEGSLKNKLIHGDFRAYVDNEGKESILHYKVIKQEGLYTHLDIELETGRYHQIRAQLAYINAPILGDTKYGCCKTLSQGMIALEHIRFIFPHPITHESIEIVMEHTNF